jgi:hypothetical protein
MMVNRQSEQVNIGYLLMTPDHGPSEESFVCERNGPGPEVVVRRRTEIPQALGYLGNGRGHSRISGVAKYADAPIDGDWTRGPAMLLVQPEPAVGVFVVNMSWIE